MRIIIIGPQASGKGTQAELLAKKFNLTHLNFGEYFRHEVHEQTDIGKQIAPYMHRGELVPAALNNLVIKKALTQHSDDVVLDGYPRTLEQAKFLEQHGGASCLLLLKVPDIVCIQRISGRRVCDEGHDYHVLYDPPKKEGICDHDGLPLHMRDDDAPEAIKKRLEIYHSQTEPIIRLYEQKGMVLSVNGELSIDKVHDALVAALLDKFPVLKNAKSARRI